MSHTINLKAKRAPEWIDYIFRGNLLHSKTELKEAAQTLDAELHDMRGNFLSNDNEIFRKLGYRKFQNCAHRFHMK